MNIVPNPIEPRPIFTTQNIMKGSTSASDRVLLKHTPIISQEVLFTHTVHTTPIEKCTQASKSSEIPHRAMEIPTCMHNTILSVYDITDSLHTWSQTQLPDGFQWEICQVFTHNNFSSFANAFRHVKHDAIQILPWDHIARTQCNILDISYVQHTGLYIFNWLHYVVYTIQTPNEHYDELHLIMFWITLK